MIGEAAKDTRWGPFKFFWNNNVKGEGRQILDAFQNFIALYNNKIRLVKSAYGLIQKKDPALKEELVALKNINRSLVNSLTGFFQKSGKQISRTKLDFSLLVDQELEKRLGEMPKQKQQELLAKLGVDYKKGYEYLNLILQLIQRENEKLEKPDLLQDRDSLLALSQMLQSEISAERNAKILMIRLLRTLKLAFVEEESERTQYELRRLRIIEVSAAGSDLAEFYKLYIDCFPPEEQESYTFFRKTLANRYRNRAARGTPHILVAKKDRETVGGIVFDYINTPNFAFCITWWDLVKTEYRKSEERIGTQLFSALVQKVQTQQKVFGKPLYGIVGEINDPKKMSASEIKTDVMDPHKRIAFWQRLGLKKVFHEYIQLTSDPGILTNSCSMFVLPLNSRWEQGLPNQDLQQIIYWLQIHSNMYSPKFLETYSPYQKMMRIINSREFFPYVPV